jgi:hypothetical protein
MARSRCFIGGLALATVLITLALLSGARGAATGQGKAGVKSKMARFAPMKPGLVSLRIRFGLQDKENTPWDGAIGVAPGRVASLEIWRKQGPDKVEGNSWKVSTRPGPRFRGRSRTGTKLPDLPPEKPADNGIIATLDGTNETSEVSVTTKQGDFKFTLAEVPYGKRLVQLKGADEGARVDVERIPVSYQLTSDPTEEDYPSAALAPDGSVYVAYVAFTHGKDFVKSLTLKEKPKDLSNLAEPTGGDQVFVMRLSGGDWSAPMPVTKAGEDIYKTAIAVDGGGRPWVFWSEQKEGNFDLYASTSKDGAWTKPLRLTNDPGPDLNPAAATDSTGRVWVAWQGFRGNNSNILVKKQDGDKFSDEIAVTTDPANEWDPAIAASKTGDVSIAWDTYGKGDYDVYFRTAKGGGEFGPPVAAAASLKFEGRPSVAYDGAGRLWVAWEEGPEKWGKDWGALVKDKGAPLYGGPRTVAVKCFEGDKPFKVAGDLAAAMPGAPGPRAAQARKPGQERRGQWGTPNSLPRLATDASGRIWMAFRSKALNFWAPVGTAWLEFATCYEGDTWLKAVYIHNTDNILDNRPAFVALPGGDLLLVGSSDGRQKFHRFRKGPNQPGEPLPQSDPVNNNIFVSDFGLKAGSGAAPKLESIPAEVPAQPIASSEPDDVARLRAARMDIGGKALRLMRGEFHRHTEISGDGAGDGMLTDMWRYGLDAASMDWIGCGDHDNGGGREYSWWITQKTTDAFKVGETFVPMYSYERSVTYPDGHRNVVWAKRGVRVLPRLGKEAGFALGTGQDEQQPAHTPDTLQLYRYLEKFDGVCASHTSGTDMGTDWRDNNPKVEPVVEIYQGCRQNYEEPKAPRAPTDQDAIGGWRPMGFVWNALAKGYRLGFQSSSDHVSTHISYCNVWVEKATRQGILEGMKKRHVYGATDNILADVRCTARTFWGPQEHMMGDEFQTSEPPTLRVKLIGTSSSKIKRVDIVKDNTYVYNSAPGMQEVEFTWTDENAKPGKTSYYYIRGEQEDGELVWVSPMWITYKK